MNDQEVGKSIFQFLEEIWPICRSITGNGVRQTLNEVKTILPKLNIVEIPSGSRALDWVIPNEWNVKNAWIKSLNGDVLVDFKENNLHLVGYSEPFKGIISQSELLSHLYSLENQPDLIPYVTSYYKKRWGFCVPHQMLDQFTDEQYEVLVDSSLEPGSLSIGELVIKGESEDEILFSTYCCHPSMANDQLSGVGLATFLAKTITQLQNRKYTYRFVFLPEIIGSAAYLELNLEGLKKNTKAAFNLTCVGDERTWSFLPSRKGNTLADKAVKNLIKFNISKADFYSWNDRGSDESMFCAPGIDLPMVSLMRSKYGVFPEYHTSADRLGITVTEKGLAQTYHMYMKLIFSLEQYGFPKAQVLGEPQLGKRGLYPDLSIKGSTKSVKDLLNIISYCDGENDIYDVSELANVPVEQVIEHLEKLKEHHLVA